MEWLQCWCSDSSLWDYKSILTYICREKIAQSFIYSGTAWFGSLRATSGEICHLRVCEHHRAERTQGYCSSCPLLGSLPCVFGSYFWVPLFHTTSQLLKCSKMNIFTLFYGMDAIKNYIGLISPLGSDHHVRCVFFFISVWYNTWDLAPQVGQVVKEACYLQGGF